MPRLPPVTRTDRPDGVCSLTAGDATGLPTSTPTRHPACPGVWSPSSARGTMRGGRRPRTAGGPTQGEGGMDEVWGGGPAPAEGGQDGTWAVDLTLASLRASAWRGTNLPKPFCAEVGRRMLLAELEFSEWVLRRVEKVRFERDRSVSREIAIELTVRRDAPVFVDQDGQRCWLVALSVVRGRALGTLDPRAEGGAAIRNLGHRGG